MNDLLLNKKQCCCIVWSVKQKRKLKPKEDYKDK